ncbi:MAG: hypothetical protein FIA97_02625 [Methylococcaceae bacterium]|nr:hypothetical protein [Methylococcaceae bacterium]
MLKTIDILLGISVVMLLVSMAVTVLTQFVTALVNTRGRHLMRGLADLLQQIDPTLSRAIAETISRAVLTHPMISHMGTRPGAVIHREEFTKLLMDLATGLVAGKDGPHLSPEATATLKQLLEANGIADPAKTLDNVRSAALCLELANPELATNVRHGIALMQEANSKLVAKINSWFDQTIDRVSDRFTASTRLVTVACSFVIVIFVQLDSICVINRLSVDDGLRNRLVEKAFELGNSNDVRPVVDKALTPDQREDIQQLMQMDVVTIANSYEEWKNNWRNVSLQGLTLSVFLLSLGAPFWYNALKNLLKLRSVVASKDDSQRQARQGSTPSPQSSADPAMPSASSALTGERGILG